jgi:hypothetical protein
MSKIEEFTFHSEPIRFQEAGEHVSRGRPKLVYSDRSLTVVVRPPVTFRLQAIEFMPDSEDLDIVFVQIGNVLCAPLAKRHPTCNVATNILVQVSYRGLAAIETRLKFSGFGLVEE